MTSAELFGALGTVLGTGGATFFASWTLLFRKVSNRLDKVESRPRPEVNLSGIREDLRRLEDQVRAMNERLQRTVTDEEFVTHTTATAETINTLTGKVGHAMGAIEAWYNAHRGR